VRASSVHVSFGDGHSARRHTAFTYAYSRRGSYTIVLTAADKVGNKRTSRRVVRVG
jgi:hypothetical protein